MNKKEALTQLEIMATNATGRLGSAKSEEERALLSKEIEALDMGINAINWRNLDNETLILPSGELLVDTKYANEAKSVRLMDREGFTRVFEEPKTGRWIKTRSYGDYWECDQCGCTIATKHPFNGFWSYNYCPNCGAKMEMGVDPNNCRKCELANECDLHICIKAVRKRMSERSKE